MIHIFPGINDYIVIVHWKFCYVSINLVPKREIVVVCIGGWPWIWGQSYRKEAQEEKSRDQQRRRILSLPVVLQCKSQTKASYIAEGEPNVVQPLIAAYRSVAEDYPQ